MGLNTPPAQIRSVYILLIFVLSVCLYVCLYVCMYVVKLKMDRLESAIAAWLALLSGSLSGHPKMTPKIGHFSWWLDAQKWTLPCDTMWHFFNQSSQHTHRSWQEKSQIHTVESSRKGVIFSDSELLDFQFPKSHEFCYEFVRNFSIKNDKMPNLRKKLKLQKITQLRKFQISAHLPTNPWVSQITHKNLPELGVSLSKVAVFRLEARITLLSPQKPACNGV